jgi:hypothetical protein
VVATKSDPGNVSDTHPGLRWTYEHDEPVFLGQDGLVDMPSRAQVRQDETHAGKTAEEDGGVDEGRCQAQILPAETRLGECYRFGFTALLTRRTFSLHLY